MNDVVYFFVTFFIIYYQIFENYVNSNLCFLCKRHFVSFDVIKFLVTSIFFDLTEFNSKSSLNEDLKYGRG